MDNSTTNEFAVSGSDMDFSRENIERAMSAMREEMRRSPFVQPPRVYACEHGIGELQKRFPEKGPQSALPPSTLGGIPIYVIECPHKEPPTLWHRIKSAIKNEWREMIRGPVYDGPRGKD